MRTVKKAARVKRIPIPKDTELFFMGDKDTGSPRTRNIKRLPEGTKVPVTKRPRRIKNVAVA